MKSMRKLNYLVTRRKVATFIDHANVVYVFDPYGQNPGMSGHKLVK